MLVLFLLACGSDPGPVAPTPTASPARIPKTVVVDCLGGGDYLTLQDAVAASRSGDTLQARPCTYFGRLDFQGKTLRIESTDGAAVTTIQAVPGDAAVEADHGEGPGTAIVGFTIAGGGSLEEGVVDVEMSALLVDACVITGGTGAHAVHSRSSQLVIRGTTIVDNAANLGWTVYAQRGGVHIVDSTIVCGTSPIGLHTTHGQFLVDRTTIDCTGAQTFYNEHAIGRIQRSTLKGLAVHEAEVGNTDTTFFEDTWVDGGITAIDGPVNVRNGVITGGPIDLQGLADSGTVIEGTVIGDAVCGIRGESNATDIRNNALFGLTSELCGGGTVSGKDGNIAADCLHVSPATGDWHLTPGSPCVDAGPPEVAYDDVDGTRNDIGIYGGPLTQDGGW